MEYTIALVPGDGIGPEVMEPAKDMLAAVSGAFGHTFTYIELEAGGKAIDVRGEPLPAQTLEAARRCDALLLGAVGGPKWDGLPGHLRPERALLGLRAGLGVYANLRPAALLPQLRSACPLKDAGGFDLLVVRELTGGLYFGKRGHINTPSMGHVPGAAFDTETYSWEEIDRILRAGYDAAGLRRKKVCIVDKANVLESSRFWREVAAEVSADYPGIETSYLYVDNAAMQLIRAPHQFDVIITSNLFGDILSDEAAVLTGSIGMLPSASLGAARENSGKGGRIGMYEPIHGSAPDIAGKDIANPLAMILSAAMMLRYSFGLETEAAALEQAVYDALDSGLRTADIAGRDGNETIAGTKAMGRAVLDAFGRRR